MKRSPIKRSSKPIRRRAPLIRGDADIKRKPNLRRKRPDPAKEKQWRRAVADVQSRSGGKCEAYGVMEHGCTIRGDHCHHVVLRSRGGPDEAWNLLHVCRSAHDWIHSNVAEATRLGLIRSRPPTKASG